MKTLSPENILPLLSTSLLGRGQYAYSVEFGSTNAVCKEMAENGAPSGSLAVCEKQTAGRGRLGRAWETVAGEDLTQSVLLRIPDAKKAPLYTFCAAIAVREAVAALDNHLKPMIKWPNDVLIQGKKICGILCELTGDAVIIGVGINVNRTSFPPELAPSATSIHLASGKEADRCRLFAQYLLELEQATELLENSPLNLFEKYRSFCVTLGAKVRVIGVNGEWLGKALDVDETGALLVEDQTGTVHTVLAGDVSVRGLMGYSGETP